MRFVVYAYESIYCGNQGIYNICVTEVNSLEEADDIGEAMAYEVIDSYSHLFETEDSGNEDYETTSPEWEYARILPKWDNISTEELDTEAADLGYNEFINKYCKFEGADEFFAMLDSLRQVDGVGHTEVGAYTIDTCYGDNAYETGIWLDPSRMAIPAIYPNRAAAESGHKFWCIAAATEPTKVWDAVKQQYVIL